MKTAYKLRFVPLVVTATVLLTVAVLKYVVGVDVGLAFGWSVGLTFAAFIYLQAMREPEGNRRKAAGQAMNPPLPPTHEEVQRQYEQAIQTETDQQRTNIAFRSLYLFFSVMLLCLSVTIIVSNKEYLYGGIGALLSTLFIIHSIMVLRKWIFLLRALRKVQKKNVFDKEDTPDSDSDVSEHSAIGDAESDSEQE